MVLPSNKFSLVRLLLVVVVIQHCYILSIIRPPVSSSPSEKEEGNDKDESRSAEEEYKAATTEEYIMSHMKELGYDPDISKKIFYSSGCEIYVDKGVSTDETFDNLHKFIEELDSYNKALSQIDGSNTKDILKRIRSAKGNESRSEICKPIRLHPDGIRGFFPSEQISFSNKHGYVEPLLPPLRHPKFCLKDSNENVISIDFIIHDFEKMCMDLKPSSKIVLIDMGASLDFHKNTSNSTQPIVHLMESFERFGLFFDHIYAFEVTDYNPKEVYQSLLPEKYFPSYHWINAGVSAGKDEKMNPLYSIVTQFNEDDIVIVKLDIDNISIEQPMIELLLDDDVFHNLVDHFYFEHHVRISEVALKFWQNEFKRLDLAKDVKSVKDSLEFMHALRKKGIASHYWI